MITVDDSLPTASSELQPIYIIGRRHSGTTFIDVVVGSCDGVTSLGEIVTGLHNGESEEISGGLTLGTSPFWSRARAIHTERTGRDLLEDGEELYQLSSIQRFASAYVSNVNRSTTWRHYASMNKDLIASLSAAAGGDRILDSNKEYTRGLMFLKGLSGARVLHVVRNPVSIAGSHYFRVREKGMPIGFMKRHFQAGPWLLPILMLTVGLSWTVGMMAACLLKARFRGRILDVSYERLCDDPEHELDRIGHFLGVDLSPVSAKVVAGEPLYVEHTVGGNELKQDGSFTFVANSRGRRQLPATYRVGMHATAWPGYLLCRLLQFD